MPMSEAVVLTTSSSPATHRGIAWIGVMAFGVVLGGSFLLLFSA